MTMSRIAGATLPAQKTRKDDHTYHPIVIEGTGRKPRKTVVWCAKSCKGVLAGPLSPSAAVIRSSRFNSVPVPVNLGEKCRPIGVPDVDAGKAMDPWRRSHGFAVG